MNRKGFTLIELLAVIIILGILMIIAIPSVTKYISDSRKSAYIDTAKEIIGGARNIVNEGKLGMYDTNTTYYIDQECIQTENASKSPYGEFTKAYVVVTYNGKGYNYYWTSVDDTGIGIKNITNLKDLDEDDIESDLNDNDIDPTVGINSRSKYTIINKDNNCKINEINNVSKRERMNGRYVKNLNISTRWADGTGSFGSAIIMTVHTSNYEQYNYDIIWQYKTSSTGEWIDIEGATEHDYSVVLTMKNYMFHWRAIIFIYEE